MALLLNGFMEISFKKKTAKDIIVLKDCWIVHYLFLCLFEIKRLSCAHGQPYRHLGDKHSN